MWLLIIWLKLLLFLILAININTVAAWTKVHGELWKLFCCSHSWSFSLVPFGPFVLFLLVSSHWTASARNVFFFPEPLPDDERLTPSPIDPDCVEVDVNFNPDPADLVLSSVPGGELFDPRKHKFAEEDLKPQPMIKKAKKVFVPEEQKVRVAFFI